MGHRLNYFRMVCLLLHRPDRLLKPESRKPSIKASSIWPSGGWQAYSWKGPLDDVRIYDRALSAAEVTQLYNLEKP